MALDRDVGVAVARALRESVLPGGARGWEMLAATGVRGLRTLHESDLFGSLELTDSGSAAFEVLSGNVARSGAAGARARAWDARRPLERNGFDFVDLDPYGSPEPFLPAAIEALRPPAVLAVTATDLRVLASVERGACERRYGARPVGGRLGPEGGLRILLAWISSSLAHHDRRIEPLLAYVRDHYVRAYVRVPDRPRDPEPPIGLLEAERFDGPWLPPNGPFGPLWLGPLGDPAFIERLALPENAERPHETGRFLERLRGEARIAAPFYYETNEIARHLGLVEPPAVDRVVESLREGGFPTARTHARDGAFRTLAPRSAVEAAARAVASSRPPVR